VYGDINGSNDGAAIYGTITGDVDINGIWAGYFNGNVKVTGDTTTGNLTSSGYLKGDYIGVSNTSSTSGKGLSLFNGATSTQPTYGVMFAGTGTFGTYGSVIGDWATYFTMDDDTKRGWIFRRDKTNVASISGGGNLTVAGSINIPTEGASLQVGSKRVIQNGYSASTTAGQWYRIAVNTGSRASGTFTLRDYISSGGHSTLTFFAGAAFNWATGMSFTMIGHQYYSTPTFLKIRILTKDTYDSMYVEVYTNRTGGMDFTIYDNTQSNGWTPLDWAAGSIPSGYSSREYEVNRLFVVGDYDDRFTITRGGSVGIGTHSPSKTLYVNGSAGGSQSWNASDQRLKTNIKLIDSALEKLTQIRGVRYEWKDGDEEESQGYDDKVHFGVIAQEVEPVFPELIDNPGETEETKHVEYNGLVGIMVESIKALKRENHLLKSELERVNHSLKDRQKIETLQQQKIRKLEQRLNQMLKSIQPFIKSE